MYPFLHWFLDFSVKNEEKLLPRLCLPETDGVTSDSLWSGKNQHSLPFKRSERPAQSMSLSLQEGQENEGMPVETSPKRAFPPTQF